MFRILISFLLLFNGLIHAQGDFNILDFGAVPGGKMLNTEAIQDAVDAAHQNGGGKVIIPEGKFLSGSIVMKSGVELCVQEGGVLLGSTNPQHYIKLNRWKAFIIADGQEKIAITGRGEINGQGRQLALNIDSLFYAGQIDSSDYNFVEMRPKWYLRPQLIEFVRCRNVVVKQVTLKNAACWVQTHDRGENILIDSVRTESDAFWNNDGIDIQDCRNVRVTNCYVNTADDGICLKSQLADELCDSIYIGNCIVRSSASALKFGTVSHGGFRNVVIENIRVFDTFRSAVAIECVDGGVLENVLVQNIEATNTGNAIFIRLGQRTGDHAGVLRNVTLRNIRVDVAFERPDYAYEIRGPALPFFHNTFPSSITGIPGHPVENVTLENIEINYPGRGNSGLAYLPLTRLDGVPEAESAYPEFSMFGELPAWGFYIRHVTGLTMKNIRIGIDHPDYRPAFVLDDVGDATIDPVRIQGDQKPIQLVARKAQNITLDKTLKSTGL